MRARRRRLRARGGNNSGPTLAGNDHFAGCVQPFQRRTIAGGREPFTVRDSDEHFSASTITRKTGTVGAPAASTRAVASAALATTSA